MNEPLTTTTSREDRPASRQENRERWRGLVEDQRAGGQSKQAFCRERGISYERFLAWAKRFAEGDKSVQPADPLGSGNGSRPVDAFCELRVGAPAAFEIALGGGAVVRVSPGFDEKDLARLLRIVGEATRAEAARNNAPRETPARAATVRSDAVGGEALRPC